MNEVDFGFKKLPLLLCGSSPFMGAGQFGAMAWLWSERFFHFPDRMAEIFSHFCELGFPGAHLIGYPSIIEAARLTRETHPLKVAVSLLSDNWTENLELVAELEPEVVFVHGAMTDHFLGRRMKELLDCLQAIRDIGAFPGMATHNSYQTLSALQESSNPLTQESFGLLLPLNFVGWSMGGSINEVISLLSKTDDRYPVMVMKVLSAGKLPPKKALEFVFGIPQVKVAAIGMVEKEQANEIASIGHALIQEKG